MKFGAIRFIDNYFIRLIVWFLILFNLFNIDRKFYTINNILVIRPGGIGDAICTLPFIKKLKESYPNARISVLAMPRNKEIFENNSDINQLFIFEDAKAINPVYLLKFLKTLKKQDFDIVFDLEQWYRFPAVISWIVGNKIRVGYATNEKKFLYNKKIEYSQNRYEVLCFLDQLKILDITIKEDCQPNLTVFSKDITFVNQFLKKRNIKKFIIIAPCAYKTEKMWPKERYTDLINEIINKFQIILLGGKDEASVINYIASKIDKKEKIISIAGELTIMQCAAIIKKAKLSIGGDTGLMHIAAAVGTPTISLFGPTIKEKWAPRGKNHYVISKNLKCSPCAYGLFAHIPKCKKGARCMNSISVREVLDGLKVLTH